MFNFWTFIFEILNFIAVVYILYRVLFRPVKNILQQREREIRTVRDEIERTQKEVAQLRDEYENGLKELEKVKAGYLEDARVEALKERERIIKEAMEEIETERKKTVRFIRQEKLRALEEIKERVISLSVEMAGRLMSDISDDLLQERLLKMVLERLENLPQEEVQRLSEVVKDGSCRTEIYSARPLSSDQIEELRSSLQEILNCRINLVERQDTSLIAGIRLKIDGHIFDGTLRGNLDAIAEKLKKES
ncbi:MAG: F0F1 ATP synthase subunit delta [Nitrospirota bacterium]|nr:F0F1 ATP synthase subunit delta [Nitrospirota bacterium]